MHYFDNVRKLPCSKNSSPKFTKRKPNGKLRTLIDSTKINFLLQHKCINNNFPVGTMTDAGKHLANKSAFAKLDCSHAYFTFGIADELSEEPGKLNAYQKT